MGTTPAGGERPALTSSISGVRLRILTLALLAGSLLIAVLVAEFAVRMVAPQQLILIRPDVWHGKDTLGWVRRPNAAASINTGERTVDLFTDREGYRVGAKGRAEAPTRILLMGDSFMEALQVQYEQSLAGLLENRLSERLGRPVAVRNAGVAGWDPNQYLLATRAALRHDTFDLVLVSVFVGNDVVNRRIDRFAPRSPAERHNFHLPRRLTWSEWVDAIFYPINDALEVRSQLFIFLKSRFQTSLMRLRLTEAYVPFGIRRRDATSPAWNLTADILAELARMAANHGVPALFVLVPSPQQVDPAVSTQYVRGFGLDSTELDVDQPSRLLATLLRSRQLAVFDALPGFREARAGGTALYGSVDTHLTIEGHVVLERLVEETVAGRLEHDRPGQRPGRSTASHHPQSAPVQGPTRVDGRPL